MRGMWPLAVLLLAGSQQVAAPRVRQMIFPQTKKDPVKTGSNNRD